MSLAGSGGAKLAVVLLHEEGDQFNASSIAQGKAGGKATAEALHRIARAEVSSSGGGAGEAVVHLVTRASDGSPFGSNTAHDLWLAGFASSAQLCHLSLPLEDSRGGAGRILQLLTLYLPLASISTIFVGSLHTNYLAPYLEGMPPRLRAKITLVETVTIAPGVRELVEAGLLKVTGAFKDLFGEMDEGLHQPTVDWMGVEELEAKLESTTLAPQTPPRPPSPELFVAPEPVAPPPRPVTPEAPAVAAPVPAPTHSASAPAPLDTPAAPTPAATPSKQQSRSQARQQGRDKKAAAAQARGKENVASQPPPPPSSSSSRDAQSTTSSRSYAVRPLGQRHKQSLFPAEVIPPYPSKAFTPRLFRFNDPKNRPCNLFWIQPSGCPFEQCSYSHSHPFTLDEYLDYRLFVKSTPCPDMIKHGRCKAGDACVQGHRCPYTERECPHNRKGMCHYKIAGLPHSDPAPRR